MLTHLVGEQAEEHVLAGQLLVQTVPLAALFVL
jgi:hypothetical protein